jgi:hypothetical protein
MSPKHTHKQVKEYGTEMSHITNELDSQLGGLVTLHSHSRPSRYICTVKLFT